MTASPDTTIRVWNVGTSQTTLLLKAHDAPVTGLSLHPTGDYLLSSSLDQHWAFSDIRTGRLLTKVYLKFTLYYFILSQNYSLEKNFLFTSFFLISFPTLGFSSLAFLSLFPFFFLSSPLLPLFPLAHSRACTRLRIPPTHSA